MSHLHLAGDWNAFLDSQIRNLKDADLTEPFTRELFVDKFMDTFQMRLADNGMWIRLRKYHDGTSQWSLKWNVRRLGDELQYEEAQGIGNIVTALRAHLQVDLDEEDMDLAFPRTIATFSCVRVKCPQSSCETHSVYFEIAKIGPDFFYPLTTWDLSTSASAPLHESNPNVLSKLLAYLYRSNHPYFEKLFPKDFVLAPSAKLDTLPEWFREAFSTIENSPNLRPTPTDYTELYASDSDAE